MEMGCKKSRMGTPMMNRFVKFLSLSIVALHAVTMSAKAAPLLVDFGPGKVVTGVFTKQDGSSLVSGYSVDPSSGSRTGILIAVSADGSSVTTNTLGGGQTNSFQANKVQGNYVVGWGSTSTSDQGLAWHVSDLTHPIVTQSFHLGGADDITRNFDVNASGNFAGSSSAGLVGTFGNIPANTATALDAPSGSNATGLSISSQNYIAGSITPFGSNTVLPVVWTTPSSYVALSAGANSQGFAQSISSSGSLVGGSVGIFDEISETIKFQAAVWTGDNWADATLLTNADGTPFFGDVLGVTDDGYAVGKSPLGGFIWNLSWANPVMFNTWAQTELGISIPTWVTSVNDIFSDGSSLSFALEGSAYLVRTTNGSSQSVPEPMTVFTVLTGLVFLSFSRRASAPTGARGRRG